MADKFYTISAPSEGIYKEKMSKFLAFAFPVVSAEEAKAKIAEFQKKYFDARHVCWAYMLGAAREQYQLNDNGEPSGTTGKPIMGQINSNGLTNIVVIVVRYFGGIKLGTSGLIVAYKEAAREAIMAGNIIECHEMAEFSFHFPYMSMNEVMRLAKQPDVVIKRQNFDNSCEMTLQVRADDLEMMQKRITAIDGVTLN